MTATTEMQSIRRGAICLVCSILAATAACAPSPGPEEAVRLWLQDAEAAIEEEERRALMDMISDRYSDARGNDRSDVDRLLRLYFLRSRNIMLAAKVDELTIMGDSAARVLLTAGMAERSDGVLGFNADAYRFELELEDNGDRWTLIGARWAELGGDLR